MVISALHERFAKASVTLLALNLGLTVAESMELRRVLKEVGGELKVAKHTLVKRAVVDTPYDRLDELLEGPRGLVFGYADPVAVAKALVGFVQQHSKLQIDGGAIEGRVIPSEQVKALATMPNLTSLQSAIVRQTRAPGSRVIAAATGPARRLAGAVAALVSRLETSG